MQQMQILINPEIVAACPQIEIATIQCEVVNSAYDENLWQEINDFCRDFKVTHSIEDINKRLPISATRQTYKNLGKDPNRYRPSAEALCRRILKGMDLYQIDTVVDLINLVSIKTGYSIGGFDADKIDGNTLTLGVGKADEKFEAIGRGRLNIEALPVYRDKKSGIGTPTSDEERTKISRETSRLLMIINGYSGREGLKEAVEYSCNLLKKYTHATHIIIEKPGIIGTLLNR